MKCCASDNEPPGRRGQSAVTLAAHADVDIADPDALLTPQQARALSGHLLAATDHLGLIGEVRVRVVGDAAMSAAHERYSNVPGTTDVLTFDLRNQAERAAAPHTMDVDIMVCADEARRAAAPREHPVEHELLLYALHGVLHCLGHDDHDEQAYARMHALEDEVLAAIGVGPIFAAPARDTAGCQGETG